MLNGATAAAGEQVPAGPFLHHIRPGAGVHVAFTGVDAGNLAFHVEAGSGPDGGREVTAARHRIEEQMGVRPGRTEYLEQVHSAEVVAADGVGWQDAQTPVRRADARVSPSGRDPMAVMVADCLPVVFVSRRAADSTGETSWQGPTAVAHVGRRGLLDGVLQATVRELVAAGAGEQPGEIAAWIGPGICGRCYEVPEQMRADAAALRPALASSTAWGTPSLDLPAGAAEILGGLGIRAHRVDHCTREDERLYSHRRAPGAGRFAGLVWHRDDEE